jgi:hypothetical protein
LAGVAYAGRRMLADCRNNGITILSRNKAAALNGSKPAPTVRARVSPLHLRQDQETASGRKHVDCSLATSKRRE